MRPNGRGAPPVPALPAGGKGTARAHAERAAALPYAPFGAALRVEADSKRKTLLEAILGVFGGNSPGP